MPRGILLETFGGRKLIIFITALLLCQIICFLICGLIAPSSKRAGRILSTRCSVEGNNTEKWFYSRGKGHCKSVPFDLREYDGNIQLNNTVFVFQMPLPKDAIVQGFSRWQQKLLGVLEPEIIYQSNIEMEPSVILTLDSKLAYRNKGDPDSAWKPLSASRNMKRILECSIAKKKGYMYHCASVPLFELGSLHHDFYLVNMHLPVDQDKKINQGLDRIDGFWLVTVHQNVNFVKVWISLKTFFSPVIIGVIIWFWRRIHQLSPSPALLEYMLIILGAALTFFNLPLEYLALCIDMPFKELFGDIQQDIFYAALLSFWLILAGENFMVQDTDEQSALKSYCKHVSVVVTGCLSLLIVHVFEHGAILINPFAPPWTSEISLYLVLTFITFAGVYFIFLAYEIRKVFFSFNGDQSIVLSMSKARRFHYEGVIYRFKFVMLATVVCAAMTIAGFILGQLSEDLWKWNYGQLQFSTFFVGVYGMWNIYIFALMVLYAPSHEKYPSGADVCDSSSEFIK